jgi:hypothetical protein
VRYSCSDIKVLDLVFGEDRRYGVVPAVRPTAGRPLVKIEAAASKAVALSRESARMITEQTATAELLPARRKRRCADRRN